MGRDGTKNLIPFDERSEEEQKEIRKKGGIASGKARKEKADLRKLMELMLSDKIPGTDMTYAQGITVSMLKVALDPEQGGATVNAYKEIKRTIGQDEAEQNREAIDLLRGILEGNVKNAKLQSEPKTE